MVDARDVAAILDAARSEVKRWGGTDATLTHGALVLAERWEEDFAVVFGADGREQVQSLLKSQRFLGSEPDLTLILESHDRTGALQAIHAELAAELAPQPVDVADVPAQETESVETGDRDVTIDGPAGLPERTARLLSRVLPAEQPLRSTELAEVAAQLLRVQPSLVALIGERGVGRTTSLSGLAHRLDHVAIPLGVFRLAPDTIVANPASTLRMILDDIVEPSVVVLDDFDALARLGTENPDRELLALVEGAQDHSTVRLLVVLAKRYLSRLSVLSQSLTDSMVGVTFHELPPEAIAEITRDEGVKLAQDRQLELDQAVVAAAIAPAVPTDGALHPGLALSRVDLACARALLAGDHQVTLRHLAPAGDPASPLESESQDLADALRQTVKGQHDAVDTVARRLTLTRANLDLRPERPNGVFLFVGPTGVGKTELAKEIAVHEYGGSDRLIRLDMSEFAQEWALSRLVGPMPGYVGSTEPESWLTTKVAAMPQCVILLDEIEKAHPRIWNTFLQVFDAGRLTDSRGVTANFSDAVVVMTSNLGVQEAGSRAVGFAGGANAARDRLLAVVRESMAPELLNRMDEIVVFNALSMEAIVEIAQSELDTVVARLAAAGWVVNCSPEVPGWLAKTGYDPAYGARHLQRNIEREVLFTLATAKSRNVTVQIDGQQLSVIDAP